VEQPGTSSLQFSPFQFEITVPVPTNSTNEWVRAHWKKYHTIKTEWYKRLHWATIQNRGKAKFGDPIQNASLTIERRGLKLLDEDNLIGGVKPVIDALVKLGFLEDDTPDVIQHMNVFQTKVMTFAEQKTRITIIECKSETS